MYGIRTFLRVDGEPVKFEIIFEGRLSLTGAAPGLFPVDALDQASCIAEKLLAHADRGLDDSTHARDLVDLAFMAACWPSESWPPALKAAEAAYGAVVVRELDAGLSRFGDRIRRRRCVDALGITDKRTLARGTACSERTPQGAMNRPGDAIPLRPGRRLRRAHGRCCAGGGVRSGQPPPYVRPVSG